MQYNKIIEYCELQQDFDLMGSSGDELQVGENGHDLSGGQQQRVVIARALYAPANVILMDDPFSALDDRITSSIHKAIKTLTTNKTRTVILTTQNMDIVKQADFIIAMEEGSVAFAGTYEEARNSDKLTHVFASDETEQMCDKVSMKRSSSARWKLLRNLRKIKPASISDSFEEANSRKSVRFQTNLIIPCNNHNEIFS